MTDNTNNTPAPRDQIAPEFPDMPSFNALINDVGYARYNYQRLLNREKQFTEMIPGAADVALYNSGAAAMHSVIDTEELRPGDVVLCANAVYGTTKQCVEDLKKSGIRVVFFDSTNPKAFRELIKGERPRMIIVESIANSKNMEVTPLKELGEAAAEATAEYRAALSPKIVLEKYVSQRPEWKAMSPEAREKILEGIDEFRKGNNPFVFRSVVELLHSESGMERKESIRAIASIAKHVLRVSRDRLSLVIDNTLPSPHLINPLEILKGMDVEKTIVESGTKHYQEGKNEITLGLAYSDSADIMKNLKEKRIALGAYLQPSDERKIPETIAERMPDIMKNHARNALKLAELLSAIPGFDVAHPNLPSHRQHELVRNLAPEGAVTIFYVRVPEGKTGEEFMQKMKDAGGEKIGLGSSFGHTKTWLSNYGQDDRTVRIAAGSESETDFEEVLRIFRAQ